MRDLTQGVDNRGWDNESPATEEDVTVARHHPSLYSDYNYTWCTKKNTDTPRIQGNGGIVLLNAVQPLQSWMIFVGAVMGVALVGAANVVKKQRQRNDNQRLLLQNEV